MFDIYKIDDKAKETAKNIKMVVFDVDGVLTDGRLIFGQNGEELKFFHSHDGLGISLLHKAGIKTAIITGRKSQIVKLRANELKIKDIYQNSKNKIVSLEKILNKYKISLNEIAYIGDDINDLGVLSIVGLPCTVFNAAPEVKERAKLVSEKHGGKGAVREIVEYILKSQNIWDKLVNDYLNQGISNNIEKNSAGFCQ